MSKVNKYTFPAVFSFYENGSIGIMFPDLPGCVSSALNLDEALSMSEEALGLHLAGMEEDGDTIPQPSELLQLKHNLHAEQIIVPVSVKMWRYREDSRKNINKMCTVPEWLAHEADDAGLNFSRTLQEGLMAKLGIKPSFSRNRKRSR